MSAFDFRENKFIKLGGQQKINALKIYFPLDRQEYRSIIFNKKGWTT